MSEATFFSFNQSCRAEKNAPSITLFDVTAAPVHTYRWCVIDNVKAGRGAQCDDLLPSKSALKKARKRAETVRSGERSRRTRVLNEVNCLLCECARARWWAWSARARSLSALPVGLGEKCILYFCPSLAAFFHSSDLLTKCVVSNGVMMIYRISFAALVRLDVLLVGKKCAVLLALNGGMINGALL